MSSNEKLGVSICNFRDVGGFRGQQTLILPNGEKMVQTGTVKRGVFYRSSSIDRASFADTKVIVFKLGIRSLIDLRTSEYSGKRGDYLSQHFALAPKFKLSKKTKESISSHDSLNSSESSLFARTSAVHQREQRSKLVGQATQNFNALASQPSSLAKNATPLPNLESLDLPDLAIANSIENYGVPVGDFDVTVSSPAPPSREQSDFDAALAETIADSPGVKVTPPPASDKDEPASSSAPDKSTIPVRMKRASSNVFDHVASANRSFQEDEDGRPSADLSVAGSLLTAVDALSSSSSDEDFDDPDDSSDSDSDNEKAVKTPSKKSSKRTKNTKKASSSPLGGTSVSADRNTSSSPNVSHQISKKAKKRSNRRSVHPSQLRKTKSKGSSSDDKQVKHHSDDEHLDGVLSKNGSAAFQSQPRLQGIERSGSTGVITKGSPKSHRKKDEHDLRHTSKASLHSAMESMDRRRNKRTASISFEVSDGREQTTQVTPTRSKSKQKSSAKDQKSSKSSKDDNQTIPIKGKSKDDSVVFAEPLSSSPTSPLPTTYQNSSRPRPNEAQKETRRLCHRHGLVGKEFRSAIISQTTKRQLLQAGMYYMTGRGGQKYRGAVVGPILNYDDGLERLYRMFVDYCGKQINDCLTNITLNCDFPFVVYCNHGKDRTGWICALILSVCGVARPHIVANYAVSDELLSPIAELTEEEMRSGGIDPKVFCRSPARAMEATLDYVNDQYGSVEQYLNTIGFSSSLQMKLRQRLMRWDGSAPDTDDLGSTKRAARPLSLVSGPVTRSLTDVMGSSPDSASPARDQPFAEPNLFSTHEQRYWEVVYRPQDVDDEQYLALPPTNTSFFLQGNLELAGQYKLVFRGVDLDLNSKIHLHVIFSTTNPITKREHVLTTVGLHQTTTTTITRPFLVQEPNTTWQLNIASTHISTSDIVRVCVFMLRKRSQPRDRSSSLAIGQSSSGTDLVTTAAASSSTRSPRRNKKRGRSKSSKLTASSPVLSDDRKTTTDKKSDFIDIADHQRLQKDK